MNLSDKLKRTDKAKPIALALSFCIPAVVVLISYIINEISPFGDYTLCSMDGFSQYYPMLMNMCEAVKEGEVFYSFNGALGFNLWAQSAYYTNSIFWIPLYFLSHSYHINYIHLAILLKIALGGLFFCLRLIVSSGKVSYKKIVFVYPALSCVWALSGYMCAFINQLMWTDVIIFLPPVILGIENICKNKSPALYTLALFLSIFSCFYLSYMVCIFCVLWFLYIIFRNKKEIKEIFSRCAVFALSSLTAGGMAAVVILPVYKALSLTKASSADFEGTLEIIYTLKDFFMRFFPFQSTSLEYGEPNLYCTLTVVFIFILFILSHKLPLRHRIATLIFVTFMFVTMSVNLGEYIWHGFHYPNQLPARQSFLAIFLLVSVAAEYLAHCSLKKRNLCTLLVLIYIGSTLNFTYLFLSDVWAARVSSLQRYEQVMDDFTALDDEDIFARMEWSDVKKNNYPQQYTYKGVGYYSSTMSEAAYDFFQAIGMDRYAKNVSVQYKQSDILNAVFGIKYILSGDSGQTTVENERALSLAFCSSEDVLVFDPRDSETTEKAQKDFWYSLCGEELSFEEGYGLLSENQMEITLFDTDLIEGKIKADSDCLLFTSIPFDEGWEIYIDGEKALTMISGTYFLSCEITEGEHQITLKYTVPGIKAGAVISSLSLLFFIGTVIYFSKRRKDYSFEN